MKIKNIIEYRITCQVFAAAKNTQPIKLILLAFPKVRNYMLDFAVCFVVARQGGLI